MTKNISDTYVILADEDDDGFRLDKFLSVKIQNLPDAPDISRSRLKNLIKDGSVLFSAKGSSDSAVKIDDPSHRVKCGESFTVEIPETVEAQPQAEKIPLEIIYEDEHLIVVNKPAGMVVHPAPGNYEGTLVNALLGHCGDTLSGINGVRRPGIVHRIDKDTSGLMVVAKSDKAHHGLAKQFAKHSLERAYQAIVWGAPNPAAGTIDETIGRDPRNRLKNAVLEYDSRNGKKAITHYQLLKRLEPLRKPTSYGRAIKNTLPPSISIVECRLETGRTHQVRVHMAHIGYPLVGDPLYGKANPATKNFSQAAKKEILSFRRQALHAYLIGFKHPITKEHLKFEKPLPNDMEQLITAIMS
jgi:23S rRNA pseudouridine1911/1915/1917 synthase